MSTELISVRQRGESGKQEFIFCYVPRVYGGTADQLHKVLTASLCKVISQAVFSLSHLHRITIPSA